MTEKTEKEEPKTETPEQQIKRLNQELGASKAREAKLRKTQQKTSEQTPDLACPTCGKPLTDHEILLGLVKSKAHEESSEEKEKDESKTEAPKEAMNIAEPKPGDKHPAIPLHMQFCPNCGTKNSEFKDEVKCDHCGTHLGSLEHARKLEVCPNCGAKGDVLKHV